MVWFFSLLRQACTRSEAHKDPEQQQQQKNDDIVVNYVKMVFSGWYTCQKR